MQRSVVLVGASGISVHLCRLLEEQHIKVKIIDQDKQKCQQLAYRLTSSIILNHNATDLAFLKEECVQNCDVFVACTHSHEANILAAVLAKQAGCEEVLSLVSKTSLTPLFTTTRDFVYTF